MNITLVTIAATGLIAVIAACVDSRRHDKMKTAQASALGREQWDAVRTRTVFFAHQSIGENILEGVRQIAATEKWPAINIIDTTTAPVDGPALLHAKVGQNGDPLSKLDGFRQALEAGAGARADIALVKFCFWDIRADTNVEKVFAAYKDTMTAVSRSFPHVTVVHTTVPLVVEDNDWRARVRRLIGIAVPTDRDNAVREILNRKIRAEYASRAPFFDIAILEQPNGAAATEIPYLAETFSSDGAHLNDFGRRVVATGLIKSLSAVRTVDPVGLLQR